MPWWVQPKKIGKRVLARLLERQVKELRYRHKFMVVAVAGSVGKTTTKLAVAELLGQKLRVCYQEGNYNDRLTVPLIFFGHQQPSMHNVFAWLRILGANVAQLEHDYPYDVVVVELGTDGPGQMAKFAYLKPDITVLTATTPEHMANFDDMQAVIQEETAVFGYSKRVLVNNELVPQYAAQHYAYQSYGLSTQADYWVKITKPHLEGQNLQIHTSSGMVRAFVRYVGMQGAQSALAAAALADMLGFSTQDIADALQTLKPFAGRMHVLDGVKDSKIIDDTYNASPVAVQAALDVLYTSRAAQRIAVLGSMNELGEYAREAHQTVGAYCDPNKLDMVVTLGRDAGRWIAPAARANGCVVHSFSSQYACASFVKKHIQTGAVVLCKGSQNGVFAEEVVKLLLQHPRDARKLVRQSPQWLRRKHL